MTHTIEGFLKTDIKELRRTMKNHSPKPSEYKISISQQNIFDMEFYLYKPVITTEELVKEWNDMLREEKLDDTWSRTWLG